MLTSLPPFAILIAGAVLAGVLSGRARGLVMLAVPILGLVNLLGFEVGTVQTWTVFGLELTIFEVDRLSLLFGYLFHIAAAIGALYSWHVRDRIQHVAAFAYAGAALGAVFAGDMVTLFVFWELMALTSVFLIWARRTEASYRAGNRYLLIQAISGLVLLAGVVMRYRQTGTLEFTHIGLESGELYAWLILLGIGTKAAFPGLHVWLTDGYPHSTPTGTVWLSAFTTKVAVYALARGFAGTELLVYVGAAMTAFPIFYAVIENDLRRVLGYSMINQIGFMVVGVGVGTELAINGAVAHAFNDVLFKGLLFMSMGAVLHVTGRINGSDLGGLYRKMPITTALCIVGAASISAFPLFSGFVSKSMVMVAALDAHHDIVWLILLFASAGVFHHAGIKIPYFAFFAHDRHIEAREPPKNMLAAMAVSALLCVLIGSVPSLLYGLLPYATSYSPYDATHVLAQTQILFFSALAFAWLQWMRLYPPELRSVNLDADWIWRRPGRALLGGLAAVGLGVDRAVRAVTMRTTGTVVRGLTRSHGPHGILARSWPTASIMVWVAVLLTGYLVLYFARP
jgi:multicomponent Na+:H+ antiporter subunit D